MVFLWSSIPKKENNFSMGGGLNCEHPNQQVPYAGGMLSILQGGGSAAKLSGEVGPQQYEQPRETPLVFVPPT